MIEHLTKETEIVRGLLRQARDDFATDAHKALSDYVLGDEATETAAGFVNVLTPKIVEMLVRAKAAASLPAFLAGDNIYDENGVPTIVIREGLGVWGTIDEILNDQAIDLYVGTESQEDAKALYDALNGLESVRFRKLWIRGGNNFDFMPETVKELKIASVSPSYTNWGHYLHNLYLHAPIETCIIYDTQFVAGPNTADTPAVAAADNLYIPGISNSEATTLDLTRTASSWHNFRHVDHWNQYTNPHTPVWDWIEPGWHTVLCPDGTITHNDNGDIVLIEEA